MGFCQWIHYSGKLMQCEVSPPYAKQTNPWLTGELLAQVPNTNDTLITDFLLYVRELETFIFFLFKDFIYLFLEGKGGWERGRETSMCGCLLHAPPLGTWPTTQACALPGSQTSDPLVLRPVLNPPSHTSQGRNLHILNGANFSVLTLYLFEVFVRFDRAHFIT